MANPDSRVTIHMATSLDGFIARKDGSVDWMETADEFAGGETMDPEFIEAFLRNYPEGQWRSRERERLISAIQRAAGEDTGKEETV